jgi:two-component system sensor histidine kinase BaeS
VNKAVSRISRGDYAERLDVLRRDEIGDLARNINRLAVTLDKNLGARQQWLAEISHELRTPVAVLQGEIEAMQDGVIPIDKSAIASLHGESLRLSRLIDDLHDLTMSDIGALSYRFEPLDLTRVIKERCDAGMAPAMTRCISITRQCPDEPLMVRGDRQRLVQLLDNLMQNSIRYTDPGGSIHVCVSRQSDDALISWQDSTPGVSDVQLPKLFDPLYRTEESRGRDTGGAGLGLSIVKKIVDAHEGRVEAAHSPSGGLAIHIQLPLQTADYP